MPRPRLRRLDFQDFPPPRFQNPAALPGPGDWKLWRPTVSCWETGLESLDRADLLRRVEELDGSLFLELETPGEDDLKKELAPLVRPLPGPPLRLARAVRRPGPARLRLGRAEPCLPPAGLHHATCLHTWGPAASRWREDLRACLEDQECLGEGPVHLVMSWRCQSLQNWVELWRPTGDALGPVLGVRHHPMRPRLDRVDCLELNLSLDDRLGMAVDVGLWWGLRV
ncbi:MAG: hypothetical protein AB1758_30180 [Candidatus Eremiobacterota bacterium]